MSTLRLLLGLMVVALLAGCGPQDSQPVAPVAVALPAVDEPVELDAGDVALVEAYWQGRNDAFAAGPDAGIAYVVKHLHPGLPYSAADCRSAWFSDSPPAGFAEHNSLVEGTIEAADGWTMDRGPLQDRDLGGGIYRMHLDRSYDGVGVGAGDRRVAAHLQVANGRVRNFLLCDVYEQIVTQASADAGGGALMFPDPPPPSSERLDDQPVGLQPGLQVVDGYVPGPGAPGPAAAPAPVPGQGPSSGSPQTPDSSPTPPADDTAPPAPEPPAEGGPGAPADEPPLKFCGGGEGTSPRPGQYDLCTDDR